jgi:uncharacterized membrane protein
VICVNDCGNSTSSLPPTYNFIRAGFENSNILYNLADTITMVLFAFISMILVSVFASALKNSKVIQNLDFMVRGRVLISIVHLTYLKVAVATMLNFQNFSPSYSSTSFNSFISVAALVYVGGVPLFYIGHAIVFYREMRSLKKKVKAAEEFTGKGAEENKLAIQEKVKDIKNSFRARTLFEEYNTDNIFQYGYVVVFLGSRLVYAVILSKYPNQPDWQLFIMAAMSAVVSIRRISHTYLEHCLCGWRQALQLHMEKRHLGHE